MSFRKRNVVISRAPGNSDSEAPALSQQTPPGVRPSYQDSRPTTSTGSVSLDDILGGHAGLPLGCSMLVEESGTTDFASALLRYYAAEGIVQKHHVHLVGVPAQWARDLPGLVKDSDQKRSQGSASGESSKERMRIAWRYERLGDFGTSPRVPADATRSLATSSGDKPSTAQPERFCHSYDLSQRLSIAPSPPINCVALPASPESFATAVTTALRSNIQASPATSIHRIVIPSFLSPALYASEACVPTLCLPFLHNLRALLRDFPKQLTAMISLPLTLYPRATGLIRWMEHLCDGVIELTPFPPGHDIDPPIPSSSASSGDASRSKVDEKAQGTLKVHKTPVHTEKGRGSGAGDDMAFALGRRQLAIMKYHLPPVEGDHEAQQGDVKSGETEKAKLEF